MIERAGSTSLYKALLRESFDTLLTPALYRGLERHNFLNRLPEDFREFLQQAYNLNLQRNRRIRRQLDRALLCFGNFDIRAIVFKGAAHIYQANEKLSTERMPGDIDLLIYREDLDRALKALRGLGYTGDESDALERGWHGVSLKHSDGEALVDLHLDFGSQRHLVSVGQVFEECVKLKSETYVVHVPSATHQSFFNIFHSEIQDGSHKIGFINLRQLHDLRMICEVHEGGIDWNRVEYLMGSDIYRKVMKHYLFQANRFLGLKVPQRFVRSGSASRHLIRCALQRRLPFVTRFLKFLNYVTGEFCRCRLEYLAGRPLGFTNLWSRRCVVLRYQLVRYRMRIFSRIFREWKRV